MTLVYYTLFLVLATATIVKSFFWALAWLLSDYEDPFLRKHLDAFFDELQGSTLFELTKRLLCVIARRFGELVRRRWLIIAVVFVPINAVFYAFAVFLGDYMWYFDSPSLQHLRPSRAIDPLAQYAESNSLGSAFVLVLSSVACSTILGFGSLLGTWWLLVRASLSESRAGLTLHLVADLCAALFATMITLFVFVWVGSLVTSGGVPFSVAVRDVAHKPIAYLSFAAAMGIASILPTVFHMCSLKILFFVVHYPKMTKWMIERIILNVSAGQKPVLTQVGNFAAAISALSALFLGLLRAMQ